MKILQKNLAATLLCLIIPQVLAAQSEPLKKYQSPLVAIEISNLEMSTFYRVKGFSALPIKIDPIFVYRKNENSGGHVNAEQIKTAAYLISWYNGWYWQILSSAAIAKSNKQQRASWNQKNFGDNLVLHTPYGGNL